MAVWTVPASLGAAAFAESVCYPIDSVKIWMQVTKKPCPPTFWQMPGHIAHVAQSGLARGGVSSIFKGMPLAIGRNALSTMIVMGFNNHAAILASKQKLLASGLGQMATKVVVVSGLSVTANMFLIPLETLKVRIQADSRQKAHLRRYHGCFDALMTFTKKNGVGALWNGAPSTIGRSACWWASSIPVYSEVKRALIGLGMADNSPCHALSSAASGLAGTVASHPLDVIKTKMQNQSAESPKYRGNFHCAKSVLQKEGFKGIAKGFLPRYCRLGPWQLVFFVSYEKIMGLMGESSHC